MSSTALASVVTFIDICESATSEGKGALENRQSDPDSVSSPLMRPGDAGEATSRVQWWPGVVRVTHAAPGPSTTLSLSCIVLGTLPQESSGATMTAVTWEDVMEEGTQAASQAHVRVALGSQEAAIWVPAAFVATVTVATVIQEPIAALLQGRDSLRLALFDLELPSSILKRPAEAEIGLEQTAASSWTAGDVKAGLPLAVVGTPFAAAAHEYLQDAVYHARVSKSLSESGVPLVLLDMAPITGLEGSPVCDAAGRLRGIVCPSLRPKQPLFLGAAMTQVPSMVPWPAVLQPLGQVRPQLGAEQPLSAEGRWRFTACSGTGMVGTAARAEFGLGGDVAVARASQVVCVGARGGWGSGVLLGPEEALRRSLLGAQPLSDSAGHAGQPGSWLVATAAHVVAGADTCDVLTQRGTSCVAHVAFRAPQGLQAVLDIALLRVPRESVRGFDATPVAWDGDHLCAGAPCCVLGHALLDPRVGVRAGWQAARSPVASFGVLSRVVTSRRIHEAVGDCDSPATLPTRGEASEAPVLLVTSARVLPGASGGALVDSRGRVIGMAVSNVGFQGATYDRVGLCLPATLWASSLRTLWGQSGARARLAAETEAWNRATLRRGVASRL